MPARWWRSWKDWTDGSGCTTRDASSTPKRLRPARSFLRNGHGDSLAPPVSPAESDRLNQRWAAALKPLDSRTSDEEHQAGLSSGAAGDPTPVTVVPRKPTFLQRERWKAIQKARRKGMSLRAIQRELGIQRATIKKYMEADGPRAAVPANYHCVKI